MDFKTLIGNKIDDFLFIAGVRPLRKVLFLSYTSSNDDPVPVPCAISEERYKIADGYKVTLVPIYNGFAKEHYYQSDLMSLIRDGHVKIFRKIEVEA